MTDPNSSRIPLLLLEQVITLSRQFSSDLMWIYRGQSNHKWELLPAAGRKLHFRSNKPPNPEIPRTKENPPPDLGRFNNWRKLSSAYQQELPENDFECLALAQHYGLPTRLLDFSNNILVALYFACEKDFDCDGSVFAYLPELYVDIQNANFYDIPASCVLTIRPFDRRLLNQGAHFLFYEDPSIPLQGKALPPEFDEIREVGGLPNSTLVKFTIPSEAKTQFLTSLKRIGISRKTMFPDLEGLSQDFVLTDLIRQHQTRKSLPQTNESSP